MATIQMQDNFDDNSIDGAKWDETDPDSVIAESSSTLRITNPHNNDNLNDFGCNLKSDISLSSGIITVQCNLTWTDPGANEAFGGMFLYKDDNNYAYIGSRDSGNYRLVVTTGGVFRYDNNPGIAPAKDIKIEYDVSATTVKFYYWNTSVWTQMGTTQTYDLGTPLYLLFNSHDHTNFANCDVNIFDNAYLVSGDYSTQYPSATSIKKVSSVSYASIKKISGVAIASVKKIAGVA